MTWRTPARTASSASVAQNVAAALISPSCPVSCCGVNVEIWSDVVCPWCYIGKRRFEAALQRFAGAADVSVTFRAFQLDPGAPPGAATPVSEVYERKFGPGQADQLIDRVTTLAAEEGLTFHLDRALRANTLLAHRVLWLARQRGVQEAVKERLLRAYFTEGRNVGDPDTLAELAAECGLDHDEVLGYLASDAGQAEVATDLTEAFELGITAVPTYVFDGRWSVPGAQDPDTFLRVLERVAELEAAGTEPS
jgi:predicted DsbA family dithiol-disulfide isomerase